MSKKLLSRGFYCFGCGRALRKFAITLRNLGLLNFILAIVDNNEQFWKTSVNLEGRMIPVISPEELRCKAREETIVITCLADQEIRRQLSRYHELDKNPIEFYIELSDKWAVDIAEHMEFPDGLRHTDTPLIPKVIHYCWFGDAPIPKEFQRYIDGWKRLCPDYKIQRWDESNYDVTKHAYVSKAYKAKKWAFVSDYARLDIVCEHGGFYFDTDVEMVRNLEELRYNEAFMGMDSSNLVSSGLGIASVAHQPMMEMLRDAYDRYEFVDFQSKEEQREKRIFACPELQSRELGRYGFVLNGFQMQDIHGIRIYPVPILGGQIGNKRVKTKYTYAFHHYAGSWVPKKQSLV